MVMKVVKKTADYTVYQKGSQRYAVKGADKRWVNGADKVNILLKEQLVKTLTSKAKDSAPAQ